MGVRPASFVQWYVILELFIAQEEGRKLSITDLIHCAGTPRSTILKAIADMAASGFLQRTPDPQDRRRVYLTLEAAFHERVYGLLGDIMSRQGETR
ncbi:MarR family transcriptional regulator [Novosphingobium sp. BL-52-GroH]|uniref:MarR family transcriptional regulator n=1 Tax=Novosphingobium sp. BL-52-GroH TaxID=3349877 RepID=UPI00384F7696